MRICGRCKAEKSLEEFSWRRRLAASVDNYCRRCRTAYKHEHYARTRQRYIDSAARRTERSAPSALPISSHSCASTRVNCGEGDPVVLEFDHLREKRFSIGQGVRDRPWKGVLNEIEKCEVVCANCHRRRTNRRGGFIRGVLAADRAGNDSCSD